MVSAAGKAFAKKMYKGAQKNGNVSKLPEWIKKVMKGSSTKGVGKKKFESCRTKVGNYKGMRRIGTSSRTNKNYKCYRKRKHLK